MAMHANHRFVDVGHAVHQVGNHVAEVCRSRIADGIWNVHRRGSRSDRGLNDLAKEIKFGARGIFGRELDVVAVTPWRRCTHFDGTS